MEKRLYLKDYDIYSIGCMIYYAVSEKIPFDSCKSNEELAKLKGDKYTFPLEEEDNKKNVIGIAQKCINGEYESIEKLKNDFEKLSEVDDFIKNDTIHFNYNEASAKVVANILELVNAITKLNEQNVMDPNVKNIVLEDNN